MLCDFCSAPDSNNYFVADPLVAIIAFPNKDSVLVNVDKNWYACNICARFIYARNQMALTKRSFETYRGQQSEQTLMNMNILHSHFFRTVRIPSKN